MTTNESIDSELDDILTKGIQAYEGGGKLYFSLDAVKSELGQLIRNILKEVIPEKKLVRPERGDPYPNYNGFNQAIDQIETNLNKKLTNNNSIGEDNG